MNVAIAGGKNKCSTSTQLLGHINERATRETAKNLGWKLMDNQPLNCAVCAARKATQKSLKKVSVLDP